MKIYLFASLLLGGFFLIFMLGFNTTNTLAEKISSVEGTDVEVVQGHIDRLSNADFPVILDESGKIIDEETMILISYNIGHGNLLKLSQNGILYKDSLHKETKSFIEKVKE